MARIRIVTPGQLGTNPRVVKEAHALVEAGHDVSVVSTRLVDFVEPHDQAILSAATWHTDRVRFDRALHRKLLRARQMLVRGWSGRMPKGVLAELSISPMTPRIIKETAARPADLFIAHYVPTLPAAAKAAARHGGRYAFDAEDFHLGDLADQPENEYERRLIQTIEAQYLPGAAYVTASSPGIADAYADTYGIPRPTVVLNVFPRSEAPAAPTPRGGAAPSPSVYWFSQTIGPDRGLECAVRAIGLARTRPHLYLRGTLAIGFADRLRALAVDAGADGRVHILPPAIPGEMAALAAAYDLGFVGETGHTPNRGIALTNKLFTYLLGGVPTIMSDIPAHRDLAPSLGNAASLYDVGDANSLAAAVDTLLQDRAALAAARVEAWRLGQERYNWDVEQTVLQELVGDVCGEVIVKAARQSSISVTSV